MWTPESFVIIGLTFFIAGSVKGVIGLGLPTVALALLTATYGLKPAMALLLIPSLVTNVWQGLVGGSFLILMRRLWSMLLLICVATWFGVHVLAMAETALLSALLGGLLCLYAGLSLARVTVPGPGRSEPWISPMIGLVNGALTGMTGSFVVPSVIYLQALGLPRDAFVQAMGIVFSVSTLALAVSLGGQRFLSMELGVVSALAIVPAIVGMVFGQKIRRCLSEAVFRRVFFYAVLILGAYIIGRSLLLPV